MQRRTFIRNSSLATLGLGLSSKLLAMPTSSADSLFNISLAEWSLNRQLFSKKMSNLEFPELSAQHGIMAVEYVNQFFKDKAEDKAYLKELKSRAEGAGVRNLLIMCDNEGQLGSPEEARRQESVDRHKKWVTAAQFLGCHAIRVNGFVSGGWGSAPGDFDEEMKLVADGLRRLCEFADAYDIDVIIENHGGNSSNGKWLSGVMKLADHPRAGTLPDFGNFGIHRQKGKTISYDSYRGVAELMPFAKGVSVKTTVYDDEGQQHPLDYSRMMKIVLDSGFRGHCGIEHVAPGREWEAIGEVKAELERVREALADQYD